MFDLINLSLLVLCNFKKIQAKAHIRPYSISQYASNGKMGMAIADNFQSKCVYSTMAIISASNWSEILEVQKY
jgi:hypothetical protein